MTVLVDSREPDDLIDKIRNRCDDVDVDGLPTGDFIVGDYIIERKRYGDFIGRLTNSNRDIWQQLLELTSAADENDLKPMLLLEGRYQDGFTHTDINPMYVTSELASVKKMDVDVMHSMSENATAKMLEKWEEDDADASFDSIRDSPTVPEELRSIYLTEGFQRIGPKGARRLLSHFDTFKDIVNASKDELTEVHRIGDATAEKIVEDVRRELPEDEKL